MKYLTNNSVNKFDTKHICTKVTATMPNYQISYPLLNYNVINEPQLFLLKSYHQ